MNIADVKDRIRNPEGGMDYCKTPDGSDFNAQAFSHVAKAME